MYNPKFPFTRQLEESDCGPVCLKMVSEYYKKSIDLDWLKNKFEITKLGVGLFDIENIAVDLGFKAVSIKTTLAYLIKEKPVPCILLLDKDHFVVLHRITITKKGECFFHIADPAFGLIKLAQNKFATMWTTNDNSGIALILKPTKSFYEKENPYTKNLSPYTSRAFIRKYLRANKRILSSIAFFFVIGTGLTWIFPAIIKNLIDQGIDAKNSNVLWSVLFSQIALIIGQVVSEWYRSVLAVRLSMKLSTDIILDFIHKLIALPLRFFDYKTNSDIIQRIEDHSRIESFLTNTIIQSLFQLATYLVFSVLLFSYNIKLFLIFNLFTTLSICLTVFFLKKAKEINYNQFRLNYVYKNSLYEFINGVIEIKLNVAQKNRVNKLTNVITNLYAENAKHRILIQKQAIIGRTINLIKGLIITLLCAYWVIMKEMSFGVMLSISFITGFLNNAVESLSDFARSAQDAKVAVARMQEIFKKEDEFKSSFSSIDYRNCKEIILDKVCFKYPGSYTKFVLNNISIKILAGKVTAIVGESGSGKTTLLKLLLAYYQPSAGNIYVGDNNLKEVNVDDWRDNCGTVMQSGYIFSATIEENISLSSDNINFELLEYACNLACIKDFILTLPNKFKTKIGPSGINFSGGQTQRLLIARAIYKNPNFIFFDEATSSLDSKNEKSIMENLQLFFKNKTVVVIAHRLSTVKNADQIIVLEDGNIAEIGNHKTLSIAKGRYYELVKNQLELSI